MWTISLGATVCSDSVIEEKLNLAQQVSNNHALVTRRSEALCWIQLQRLTYGLDIRKVTVSSAFYSDVFDSSELSFLQKHWEFQPISKYSRILLWKDCWQELTSNGDYLRTHFILQIHEVLSLIELKGVE